MDGRAFVYDTPKPYLTRLFKLDINGTGEPLSGKLMSITNSDTSWESLDLSAFAKSIFTEDSDEVIQKVGDGKGYDALSYCWGKSEETFPLTLSTVSSKLKDGQITMGYEPDRDGILQIQHSLHEFLLQLRRRKYNRFIWIDAICIDQSSSLDKENQIPFMRDLYENAECVYVWLGEASDLEMTAFQILPQLMDRFLAIEEDVRLDPLNAASFEVVGLPLPTQEVWRALGTILTRPWWSRIWTLQELVVPRDDLSTEKADHEYKSPNAYVLCGNAETQWSTLETCIEQASRLGLEEWILTGHHGIAMDHRHAFDAVMEIRTCRESYGRFGWCVSLSALLLATRRRKATMPIDVVIGQSALLDKHTVKELALKASQPVDRVFASFAKHYVRQEPKECLLNHIATRDRDPKLPSWCPNFASPPDTISLGSRWLGHYQSTKEQKAQMYHAGFTKSGKWRIPRSKIYYARYITNALSGRDALRNQYATDNPRQVQLLPDTDNILLSGIELDEVVEVIPCNPAAENAKFLSFNSIQQTAVWEADCLALARRTLPEGSEGFDIYARTLTANRVVMYPNSNTERIFDPPGEVDFVGPYLEMKRFMQATLDVGESIAQEGNISNNALRYIKVLERITKRRTFFVTRDRRIGIGPIDTVVGDKLVVIFYTPTPYLIRQNAGRTTFKMIGEAFVHGLMYGEVLDILDREQVQERKWVVA